MESKDNRNQSTCQIKRLLASKAEPDDSDSDASANVPFKKKASTGVLQAQNQQGKKTPNHKVPNSYCILCKKAGIPERKYKFHIS